MIVSRHLRAAPRHMRATSVAAAAAIALTAAACGSGGGSAPPPSSPAPLQSPSQPSTSAPPTQPATPALPATPTTRVPPASPAAPVAPVANLHAGTPHVLVTGLHVPWGVGFLPDGDALVTERTTAKVLRVTPAGKVSAEGSVAGVDAQGEGGLLGLAVSPHFASDRSVFVYYTATHGNRIVRLTVAANGRINGSTAAQHVLVDGIPKGYIHNGGRLAFGPDGMLYAGTGETGHGGLAQDKNSLGGKILRMTPTGAPAPGNPFHNLVWSYGHRNVQGLAWDTQGRMWATEFGQNTWDEINHIVKGHNYGWPVVEGIAHKAGYTDPLVVWHPSQASPSGLAYAGGALWVGALRGMRLWRIPVHTDGSLGTPKALFTDKFGRLRTVVVAPGGKALWLTTSNRDGRGNPVPGDDRIIVVPLR